MLGRAAIRSFRLYTSPSLLQVRSLTYNSPLRSADNKPTNSFVYQPPNQPPNYGRGPESPKSTGTVPGSRRAAAAPIDTSKLEERFRNIDEQIKDIGSAYTFEQEPSSTNPSLKNDTETSAIREDTEPSHAIASSADSPVIQQPFQSRNPSQPLPDLTQGIPSTIDTELKSSPQKADPQSLNITEDPSSRGDKNGDLPKTAYISSLERKQKRLARAISGIVLFNLIGWTIYYGRNWENEEQEKAHPGAPSGWGFVPFYNRVKARLRDTLDYYNEPAFPKLLPDPDPAWERPHTLILSLEDLLVHSEWSREHGWRMAKRPGVDYFLRYLSQYYELVIWTSNQSMIAQPIIQKLDPYRVVMWPLFREATRYQNGEYVKDLSYVNRNVKKILMIDTDPAHARHQPENAIILPKWKGNVHDKDLVSLIPFLEYCAAMNFDDLRAVLKSFDGKHIPTEFARRESIARQKFQEQREAERAKRPKRSMGFLSSLTGGGAGGSKLVGADGTEMPSWSDGMEQGKTYQDLVRERGQKQYEVLDKDIRDNGEKWLKEMAEEEKKLTDEAMKGMKSSFVSYLPFARGEGGKESGQSSSSNRGEKPA